MHGLWHVAVLVVVLMGGASGVLLGLMMVVGEPPEGVRRWLLASLAAAGAVALALEWTLVH